MGQGQRLRRERPRTYQRRGAGGIPRRALTLDTQKAAPGGVLVRIGVGLRDEKGGLQWSRGSADPSWPLENPPPERNARLPVHRRRAADAAETRQTAWAGVPAPRKRLVADAVG